MSNKCQGRFFEDLSVGMTDAYSKTITNADVATFANVCGDTNPMHLDDDYARETRFGERIAHGMLIASLISTVLGTKLPGPGAIYLRQSLKFTAPVKIGDTVTARVTVSALREEKKRAELTTQCTVGDTVVVAGSAVIGVPSRDA